MSVTEYTIDNCARATAVFAVIQGAASIDAVGTGATRDMPVGVFAFFTGSAAKMGNWSTVTASIYSAECVAAGAGS